MSGENSQRERIEDNFARAKILETPNEQGEAAERAMLKKETARLIREAQDFEKSKGAWRVRLMKGAIAIAGISVLLNIVQAFALAAMAPLKTVEPYLLEVDRITGEANVRKPLDKPVVSQGDVVDKFFISEYIRAREGYDWGLAQRMYDQVKAYSVLNASVFNEYDTFIKSPKSPLAILADKARVVVDINAITLDEKTNSATVRFSKTVLGADGKPSVTFPVTYWIATVRYEYPNPKLKPEERRLNPLGMKIPSYQLVQEQNRG
ncbi:TPA: virB8 family protein [Pseudomonas aeruginosa]